MRLGKYAVLLCALAACNTETTGLNGSTGPVLLEIEYVNYAWTPQFFGFFVDATGDVYSYNREGAQWAHRDATVVTEEQLTQKFSLKRVLVTTRDSAEVANVAARITQVNTTQLSAEKFVCADAGILTYRAYQYHAGSRTYTPVPLRMQGDLARQNTSQAAQDLIAYIRSLGLLTEMGDCGP
jgi:hypothetical protein